MNGIPFIDNAVDAALKWLEKPENQDKLKQTWPAKMATSVWEGLKLPGDVYHGYVDPMSLEAIERATDLAGTVMSGTLGAPRGAIGSGPVLPPKKDAIRAYHGSPHDFDKFDMAKIGTGEGAQVYGHGLYFAENPAVARSYRDNIPTQISDEAIDKFLPVWNKYTDNKGNFKIGNFTWDYPYDFLELAHRNSAFVKDAPKELLDAAKATKSPGKMYEVDLKAKPEQFLDWDKPLIDQKIHEKLNKKIGYYEEAYGEDLLKYLQDVYSNKKPGYAEKKLNDYGVTGIRYLDQGSRNIDQVINNLKNSLNAWEEKLKMNPNDFSARNQVALVKDELLKAEAARSHNYVVFDPSIIDIVRKYLAGGKVNG